MRPQLDATGPKRTGRAGQQRQDSPDEGSPVADHALVDEQLAIRVQHVGGRLNLPQVDGLARRRPVGPHQGVFAVDCQHSVRLASHRRNFLADETGDEGVHVRRWFALSCSSRHQWSLPRGPPWRALVQRGTRRAKEVATGRPRRTSSGTRVRRK
jgi:hypothetical protein